MFSTITYNLKHFTFIFVVIILILTISTIMIYYTMDENDLANLPPKDKTQIFDDRFISLFYYNASIHGGLGDAMIYPKSNKAKIYTAIYLVLIAAGILTAIEL